MPRNQVESLKTAAFKLAIRFAVED